MRYHVLKALSRYDKYGIILRLTQTRKPGLIIFYQSKTWLLLFAYRTVDNISSAKKKEKPIIGRRTLD
jgi:hypothetical protein